MDKLDKDNLDKDKLDKVKLHRPADGAVVAAGTIVSEVAAGTIIPVVAAAATAMAVSATEVREEDKKATGIVVRALRPVRERAPMVRPPGLRSPTSRPGASKPHLFPSPRTTKYLINNVISLFSAPQRN